MALYSAHKQDNAVHSEGVALMLTSHIQKALVAWEVICPRNIKASFKTSNTKVGLNVIKCYAPTNDKEEIIKEEFYNLLQKAIDGEEAETSLS